VVNPDTSTTPGEPATTGSVNRDPAVANLAVVPDSNGFYDVGDIYKAVPAESKIVFVLRHAERESGLGKESPLTEVGVQQAINVGTKLASSESFYFASTDFLRTRTTAENIAAAHGEPDAVIDTRDDIIYGSYFLTVPSDTLDALVSKRGGSFRYVSQWAYGQPFTNNYAIQHGVATYFYDLFERGDQFINEVVLANLPSWKRVNVLITHDLLTEPLAVYASNRTVDLKTYESFRWINYVAGIAVVVDASGLVTVLPAKGVDLGFLNTKEAYGDK
jgi:broad specificity phosphatase PhoE